MRAVLAEKPSVARELAAFLGADQKKDGYIEGNGYIVTWAMGHLVGLAMPEDYGIKGFRKETLPIVPNPFILVPRKDVTGKNSAPDPRAARQLAIIGEVFNRCESIIVATDAGREGELIFRYIYAYLNCRKPFVRLWVSSLTDKAITRGFGALREGNDFELLYQSAVSRNRADWLIGINSSQALSVAAGSGVYSLGRVQTPTLGIICKRYFQYSNFSATTYWQVRLEFNKSYVDFSGLSLISWTNKEQADAALKSVLRSEMGSVTAIGKKNIVEKAPLLFDLTALQKEANIKFNLSAAETLEIAQGLYEKKFITYPRTGSKYIPEDVWAEVPGLLRALENSSAFRAKLSKIKFSRLNRHIVNADKITDHHGLLITEKIPSALSAKENVIYEMVASRLLEAVCDPCVKEITDLTIQVMHYDFVIRAAKIVDGGWRAIQNNFTDEDCIPIELPDLKIDDELKIRNAVILEKKTSAPALYTEASLLNAMEHAGNDAEDIQLKKIMENRGLGTPATRAAVIEGLLQRQYIYRRGKSLVPTDKGLRVYALVAGKKISEVLMTAEWEIALEKIEQGELDSATFQKQMEEYASGITFELLSSDISQEDIPELMCPKCKRHTLSINDKLIACKDSVCNWRQWRQVCGKYLAFREIEDLVTNKQTALFKGLRSKSGKIFNARLTLNEKSEVIFAFEK